MPLGAHGMPTTLWRKNVLECLCELGDARDSVIQSIVKNGLITKTIYQDETIYQNQIYRLLKFVEELGEDREELCALVKDFIRPEMDSSDISYLIETISSIKENRKSIATLAARIIKQNNLHVTIPYSERYSEHCRIKPYEAFCQSLLRDIEDLGGRRETIVAVALPLISKEMEPAETRQFLKGIAGIGDEVESIVSLVESNGLLTEKNRVKGEGVIGTLEAVKSIKENRAFLCSVAKDFVWEDMQPDDLRQYMKVMEGIGPECVAFQGLASTHGLLPERTERTLHTHSFSHSSNPNGYSNYFFLTERALQAVKNLGEKREEILSHLKGFLTEEAWKPNRWDTSNSMEWERERFFESLGSLGEIPECVARIALAQDCRLIKPTMRWNEVVKVLRYVAQVPSENCVKAKGIIPDDMVSADVIIDKVQEINPIVLVSGNTRLSVKEVMRGFDFERELERLEKNREIICDEVKDILFKDTRDLEIYFQMTSTGNSSNIVAEVKSYLPFCKNANGFGAFLSTSRRVQSSTDGMEVCQNGRALIEKYSRGVKIDFKSVRALFDKLIELGEWRESVVSIANFISVDWGIEHLVDLLEVIQDVCRNTGEDCVEVISITEELSYQGMGRQDFINLINDVYNALLANDDNRRLYNLYLEYLLKPLGEDKWRLVCFIVNRTREQTRELVEIVRGLEHRREAVLTRAAALMNDNIKIEEFIDLLGADNEA